MIFKNKKNKLLSLRKYFLVAFFASLIFLQTFLTQDYAQADNIGFAIENPLGNNGIDDIPSVIKLILKFVFIIGAPLVAGAIIYSGFLYVSALGDPNKIKEAKAKLTNSMIGGALILGSFVIAQLIKGTVDAVSKN